jgi:hypothetical protein
MRHPQKHKLYLLAQLYATNPNHTSAQHCAAVWTTRVASCAAHLLLHHSVCWDDSWPVAFCRMQGSSSSSRKGRWLSTVANCVVIGWAFGYQRKTHVQHAAAQ